MTITEIEAEAKKIAFLSQLNEEFRNRVLSGELLIDVDEETGLCLLVRSE